MVELLDYSSFWALMVRATSGNLLSPRISALVTGKGRWLSLRIVSKWRRRKKKGTLGYQPSQFEDVWRENSKNVADMRQAI